MSAAPAVAMSTACLVIPFLQHTLHIPLQLLHPSPLQVRLFVIRGVMTISICGGVVATNSATQEVVAGGSSWSNMKSSHATMVEMSQQLAKNVKAEHRAFFTFLHSCARRVGRL